MRNRDIGQIVNEVLMYCRDNAQDLEDYVNGKVIIIRGIRLSYLTGGTGISGTQIKMYFPLLLSNHLIEEYYTKDSRRIYFITDKGRDYITKYAKLMKILNVNKKLRPIKYNYLKKDKAKKESRPI